MAGNFWVSLFPDGFWAVFGISTTEAEFPRRLGITIEIDGVDVTEYVIPDSLQVGNILTNQVDTCTFLLDGVPNDLILADWMEVVVFDNDNRIFGGYLLTSDGGEGSDLLRQFDCQCADYSARFERVRVSREYVGYSDAQVIADIFSTYLAGEGFDYTTFVEAIETHERLRYVNQYISDVLRDLAKLSGGDWYVDENKYLRFFASQVSDAPFGLSDSSDLITTFPYSNFRYNKDGTGVANRVRVVGGEYLSQETTIYVRGNGTDKRLTLPAKFRSGLRVWRNDGSDYIPVWRLLSVVAGNLAELELPDEVLYFYQDKVLETIDAWPALNKACKVTGIYEIPSPLTVEVVDMVSYAFYGKYFDEVIRDSEIVEPSVARTRALARLAEISLAKTVISMDTRQPGLRAGQLLPVKNALHGVDGQYLIQRVTATVGVDGAAKYSVECGIYSPDLTDYLLVLGKRKDKSMDSQLAYELLPQMETLTLGESTAIASSAAPYTWDNFDWEFGVWS